jgi:hypothetical protein
MVDGAFPLPSRGGAFSSAGTKLAANDAGYSRCSRGRTVLTPSPAYEHLALATRPEAMKSVFRRELAKRWLRSVRIQDFFIPRVLPAKDGRLSIQYCFSTFEEGDAKRNWMFFGHLLGSSECMDCYEPSQEMIVLPQLRLLVPVFPFDRKLKIMQQFVSKEFAVDMLRSVASETDQLHSAFIEDIELLGYRPERRAVFRIWLRDQGRLEYMIAKLAQPEKSASIFARLKQLEEAGFHSQTPDGITVPHPIAHLPGGVVFMEEVPDPSLHGLLESPNFVAGCANAAYALNKLHNSLMQDLPVHTVEEEKELLRGLTARITEIYPQIAEKLKTRLFWLEQNAPEQVEQADVPIHRDFYDKQVLVGLERTTLLDVDTISLGDPALDGGNFLAHLYLRASQVPSLASRITAGQQVFIDTYHTDDKSFWHRAEWWKAAALLRLICIYFLRPRWQKMAISILDAQVSLNMALETDSAPSYSHY